MPDIENRLEEQLLQYTYYYGIRNSNKDKQRCYSYIESKFAKEFGLDVKFDKLSVGISKIGLCIAGNLDKADKILIAPLDTPRKSYYKQYSYYPFNEKKSDRNHMLAALINGIIGVLLTAAVCWLVYLLFKQFWLSCICAFVSFLLYLYSLRNIFNFSSSAPLALFTYIAAHRRKDEQIAYVFLDHSAQNYLSLKLFLVKYKKQCERADAVIYFNNLAHGQHLVSGYKELDKDKSQFIEACEAEGLKIEDEGVLHCFESSSKLMIMTAAERDQSNEYYVKDIRSRRDKTVDVKRLKRIGDLLIKTA